MFRPSVLFAATITLAACSSDTTPMGTPKPILDTGSQGNGDAVTGQDTAGGSDATAGNDAQSMQDTGPRVDTGPMMQGPACAEAEACCPDVPAQLQGRCTEAVAMNDEGMCQQAIDIAQRIGLCLPPDHDAGVRGDIGPLGPNCMDYLACCPELGALAGTCVNTANNGDEARCGMLLGIAQQIGRCLGAPDAGMQDTGTSTVGMDAGISDTGTSSTSMDAGTSTVSDAG